MPVKFYRVVSYRANVHQFGIRNGDKLTAGPVPLAKSARAIAPQVRFWIAPSMVIIPQNPDDAVCFDVINLGWESASHVGLFAFQHQSSTRPSPTAVMQPIFVRFTKYVRGSMSGLPIKAASVIGKKRVLPNRSSCSGAPGIT
jgi:hypothetical protein